MTSTIRSASRVVRRQPWIFFGGGLLVTALVALPMAGSGSTAPYARPRLQCRAAAGVAGPLTVVGFGFPGRTGIVVRFDGSVVAQATTRPTGGFVARTRVPAGAGRGPHTVTAVAPGAASSASCVVAVRS